MVKTGIRTIGTSTTVSCKIWQQLRPLPEGLYPIKWPKCKACGLDLTLHPELLGWLNLCCTLMIMEQNLRNKWNKWYERLVMRDSGVSLNCWSHLDFSTASLSTPQKALSARKLVVLKMLSVFLLLFKKYGRRIHRYGKGTKVCKKMLKIFVGYGTWFEPCANHFPSLVTMYQYLSAFCKESRDKLSLFQHHYSRKDVFPRSITFLGIASLKKHT